MKMSELRTFDPAAYIETEEDQAEYIAAALESGDAEAVRDALNVFARVRGMTDLAKAADLNRESLYKALGTSGNPEFATVLRILTAMGITLTARPSAVAKRKSKPKSTRNAA